MKIIYPDFDKVEKHLRQVQEEWIKDYDEYNQPLTESFKEVDARKRTSKGMFFITALVLILFIFLYTKNQYSLVPIVILSIACLVIQGIIRAVYYVFSIRPIEKNNEELLNQMKDKILLPSLEYGWSILPNNFYGHDSERLLSLLKIMHDQNIEDVEISKNIFTDTYYIRVKTPNLAGSFSLKNAKWVGYNLENTADFTFLENMTLKDS